MHEKIKFISRHLAQLLQGPNPVEAQRAIINDINAVLIPRCWIGLDEVGNLHFTLNNFGALNPDPKISLLSHELHVLQHACFGWEYDPMNRTVKCIKNLHGNVNVESSVTRGRRKRT